MPATVIGDRDHSKHTRLVLHPTCGRAAYGKAARGDLAVSGWGLCCSVRFARLALLLMPVFLPLFHSVLFGLLIPSLPVQYLLPVEALCMCHYSRSVCRRPGPSVSLMNGQSCCLPLVIGHSKPTGASLDSVRVRQGGRKEAQSGHR